MDSTKVQKPKSPCRVRLEERKRKTRSPADAHHVLAAKLQMKLSSAEKSRNQLFNARMERLHAHLLHVAEVVSSKSEMEKTEQEAAELARKLEEAKFRREERFQSIRERLTTRLQLVDEKYHLISATRRIQRWVRKALKLNEVAKLALGVREDINRLVQASKMIQGGSFDQAASLLSSPELQAAAQRVLLAELRALGTEKAQDRLKGKVAQQARTLMTANIIAFHPDHIFDHPNDLVCIELRKLASLVLSSMSSLNGAMGNGSNYVSTFVRMAALQHLYNGRFEAWKRTDAENLAKTMIEGYKHVYASHLETLYRLGKDTNANESPRDGRLEVSEGTQAQLLQFENAICKVLGRSDGKQKLRAVRQVVKAEFLQQVAEWEESDTSASSDTSKSNLSSSPPRVVLLPPPQSRLEKEPEKQQSRPADMVFTRSVMDNELLAHELILDPKYQLKKEDETNYPKSLTQRTQSMMKRAFWDQILEEFTSQPPKLARAIALFSEIRQKLASLFNSHKRFLEEVELLLQEDILNDMFRAETPDVELIRTLCGRLLRLMLDLEAPARQPSTQTWLGRLEGGATTASKSFGATLQEYFQFIFDKIEELQLDMANFNLRLVGPYLRLHGVEYEQRKFNEKLSSGAIALDATKSWLTRAVTAQASYESWLNRLGGLRNRDAATYAAFLKDAFILLVSTADRREFSLPETLAMDGGRIVQIRDLVDSLILKSSMMALAMQTLSKPHLRVPVSSSGKASLLRRLEVLLSDSTLKILDLAAEVAQFVKEEAEKAGKTATRDDLEVLRKQVEGLLKENNPLFALIANRVYEVLRDSLQRESLADDLLCKYKLEPFKAQLEDCLNRLIVLSRHNQAVHATYYNQLIGDLLQEL